MGRLTVVPSLPPEQILAAIDVGSNSIKLLVARVDAKDPEHFEIIAREKEMVRLGHRTLATGRLPAAALAKGVECLTRYAALARAAGANRILAAATCAVREASNAAEFARRVKAAADVDLEVISGEEEARLVTRAVRSEFSGSADPLLVIDIGGGSTEVVVADGERILFTESLDLGALRLSEAWGHEDPLPAKAAGQMRKEIRRRLKRIRSTVKATGFRTAAGTSGTILALADITAARAGRAVAPARHRPLARRELSGVVNLLVSTNARQKLRIQGLEPRRRDIITAGALILEGLMRAFGIRTLLASERSLRDGLLLDAVAHDRPVAGGAHDLRRAAVERLGRRARLERGHAEKVRDLALSLFDQTHALHQLAGREREWLGHAAYLHDLGVLIGYARHHRHSAYLITHGELKGFSAEEVEILAMLARFHRKLGPSMRHKPYRRLDPWLRPVVKKLAALLRLADALDRTHRAAVGSVHAEIRNRTVVLKLVAQSSTDLEAWAVSRKKKLFEKVFGRSLVLEASPAYTVSRARAGLVSIP